MPRTFKIETGQNFRWGMWAPPGVSPPDLPSGFQVVRRRWVVERTFAWLGRYRRLSKDYEGLSVTTEAWIKFAISRSLLRRLTV